MRLSESEFQELLKQNPKLKVKEAQNVCIEPKKPVRKKPKKFVLTDENIQSIELTLPYPPSINRIYTTTAEGKRVYTKEAREYKKTVAQACQLKSVVGMMGELVLTMNAYRPRRAGDTDNLLKITQDSLEGICYENDSQIAKIIAERFDDKLNPRIEVKLEKYEVKDK